MGRASHHISSHLSQTSRVVFATVDSKIAFPIIRRNASRAHISIWREGSTNSPARKARYMCSRQPRNIKALQLRQRVHVIAHLSFPSSSSPLVSSCKTFFSPFARRTTRCTFTTTEKLPLAHRSRQSSFRFYLDEMLIKAKVLCTRNLVLCK